MSALRRELQIDRLLARLGQILNVVIPRDCGVTIDFVAHLAMPEDGLAKVNVVAMEGDHCVAQCFTVMFSKLLRPFGCFLPCHSPHAARLRCGSAEVRKSSALQTNESRHPPAGYAKTRTRLHDTVSPAPSTFPSSVRWYSVRGLFRGSAR